MNKAERAAEWVIGNEVGRGQNPHSDDPDDAGGPTRWGVTQGVAFKHGYKVHEITKEIAIDIFVKDYWTYDWVKSGNVAAKLLDISVNSGSGTAVRLLQRALILLGSDKVKEDGVIGPVTRGATNSAKEPKLLAALAYVQLKRYEAIVIAKPTQQKFIGGWLVRGVRIPSLG